MVILDGADARALRDLRVQQQMAYSTAVLIGCAVNNPKRFPKFQKAFPDARAQRVRQDPDTIFALMECWARSAKVPKAEQDQGGD